MESSPKGVARCSLAPQAVFCSPSNSGKQGPGNQPPSYRQLQAANIRWRHQAVMKSAVHSREGILFNLTARPKALGSF